MDTRSATRVATVAYAEGAAARSAGRLRGRSAGAQGLMNDKGDGPKGWKNPTFRDGRGAERVAEASLLGERLRAQAAAGLALGTFIIELPCPATLTAIAIAGFDFVVLDMEHSSLDCAGLEPLIAVAQAAGLPALVRPSGEDAGLIGKILDMGAHGIMAPHVDTPARARVVVEQARFPPRGRRGFSPLTRYDALREPLRALGDASYVIVQIEGREALQRAGEIAAVPGIDAVFVGPYDLALSLGVAPGSPRVRSAAKGIAAAVPSGVALGLYLDDPAHSGEWAALRFALQCVSFDGRMLASAARAVVEGVRGARARGKNRK
jgi:2-keto-3-deoxy-L-rhamnonate aldolase RhmA